MKKTFCKLGEDCMMRISKILFKRGVTKQGIRCNEDGLCFRIEPVGNGGWDLSVY